MIHSFNIVENVNGNTTVKFYQDNKLRNIILQKGTEAQLDFAKILNHFKTISEKETSVDEIMNKSISYMKKKYIFKANVNNVSIFRPVAKLLILN